MNRYESYKETPYQWIGKIPNHWQTQRVKFVCNDIFPGATPSTAKKEYWDGNIPWIPSGCCHDCDVVEAPKYITDLGLQNSSTRLIPANTTIIALTGATCSQLGYLKIEACANQSVIAFVENEKKANSRFLFYALRSARSNILTNQTGGAQAGINMEDCKNIILVFPPLEEQKAIADFLNAKTSELDAEKQNLQKQIEVLSELRQVIITNIVTKGIDNAVKTKDSGQDWIGNIPLHWKAKRFKYIGKCHNGLTYSPNDVCDENEGVLVLRSSNIQNSKLSFEDNVYVKTVPSKLMVKKGDVIICSRNGSISLVGKSAYVDEDINATYGAFMLRFRTNEDSKFMYYLLQQAIKFYKGLCFTTTVNQLTNEIFDNMWGVVPPIDEQKAIADYLDKKTAEIDEQIQLQEQQIKLIDELKQSIISQAVTGKIKVF